MNDVVIKIDSISKRYNGKRILDNLSLAIPKGSVFGLLGKNGAGKTTLLKCILGLLRVDSGDIQTLEDNPWSFHDSTKARIGYVPQSDRPYPWLKAGQLIQYTASFYPHWNDALVKRLVSEWSVDTDASIGSLSEGEAQKLLIILALGHEPELLVFDEPVASLDPVARRQFLRTILEITANRDCTIFFSTHITSDLERVADRVALLKDGQIDFCGGLDDLKDEVKRLRIHGEKNIPAILGISGILHSEVRASEAILTVRGFNESTRQTLVEKLHTEIQVEDLGLEDIFLELNR